MPVDVLAQIDAMAEAERRARSNLLNILLEEALDAREGRANEPIDPARFSTIITKRGGRTLRIAARSEGLARARRRVPVVLSDALLDRLLILANREVIGLDPLMADLAEEAMRDRLAKSTPASARKSA